MIKSCNEGVQAETLAALQDPTVTKVEIKYQLEEKSSKPIEATKQMVDLIDKVLGVDANPLDILENIRPIASMINTPVHNEVVVRPGKSIVPTNEDNP